MFTSTVVVSMEAPTPIKFAARPCVQANVVRSAQKNPPGSVCTLNPSDIYKPGQDLSTTRGLPVEAWGV